MRVRRVSLKLFKTADVIILFEAFSLRTIMDKSEFVIQEVAGCGPFQVVFLTLQHFVTRVGVVLSMLFMMFGNYNPGWRCLDSNITTVNTGVLMMNDSNFKENAMEYNITSDSYSQGSCEVFESCHNIEFSPGTSTIVTEWGLLCDKKWIPSLIISLQMAGVVVGSTLSGYMADAWGRKTMIYCGQAGVLVMNTVSIFSTSWGMTAVLRFFIGLFMSSSLSLHNLYVVEFVTRRWRGPAVAIPEWEFAGILFSLLCMWLRDWRHIHIVTAVVTFVGFIPVVWVPESLRWLEVKNKTFKLERAAEKIAMMNGKMLPPVEALQDVSLESDPVKTTKSYNLFDLFSKRCRKNTLLLTLPWFSVSVIYYAIGFGVKALYGNFYINMIIMNAINIPFSLPAAYLPNIIGRKKSGAFLCVTTAVCLISVVCFDKQSSGNIKAIAVLLSVFGTKAFVTTFWTVLVTETLEVYPTVVRGLGISWGYTMARVGGVVAPFLIPNDAETFYISFIVMAVLVCVCVGLFMGLPETKGKPLHKTFEVDENQ